MATIQNQTGIDFDDVDLTLTTGALNQSNQQVTNPYGYGYGGYGICLAPLYRKPLRAWLDQGGVYVVANIRGGGEFGETWHHGGMQEKKQNVFDDFVAAAQWLIANRYTRPARLAIEGGSNGGLLVTACATQHPELFGAVVAQVPVTDMLRYYLYDGGVYWIPDYGDPRDPKVDPIDWVERIPFSETRNYVQRVLENLQVYRVRFGGGSKLLIEADLRRGATGN